MFYSPSAPLVIQNSSPFQSRWSCPSRTRNRCLQCRRTPLLLLGPPLQKLRNGILNRLNRRRLARNLFGGSRSCVRRTGLLETPIAKRPAEGSHLDRHSCHLLLYDCHSHAPLCGTLHRYISLFTSTYIDSSHGKHAPLFTPCQEILMRVYIACYVPF